MLTIDFAVVFIQSVGGKIGLLAQVIALLFVVGTLTVREGGKSLAFFNNIAGQIGNDSPTAVNSINTDGLDVTLDVQCRLINVLNHRVVGIALLIHTDNTNGTTGFVALNTCNRNTEPGEPIDLISNGLFGDLDEFGVLQILNAAGINDRLELVHIAGELDPVERNKLWKLADLITPDEGARVDGLERHGEYNALELGKVHERVRGDRGDVTLENDTCGLVFQVCPGGRMRLIKGRHLTGAANNQRLCPFIEIVGITGGNQPCSCTGCRGGAIGGGCSSGGGHLNLDRCEGDLIPFAGLQCRLCLAAQGSNANHDTENQKNR